MKDTVTRLMDMSREIEEIAALCADPMNSADELGEHRDDLHEARQRLQDELTRLFTPLSDEQIDKACESLGFGALSWSVVARAVEKAHGIGGES